MEQLSSSPFQIEPLNIEFRPSSKGSTPSLQKINDFVTAVFNCSDIQRIIVREMKGEDISLLLQLALVSKQSLLLFKRIIFEKSTNPDIKANFKVNLDFFDKFSLQVNLFADKIKTLNLCSGKEIDSNIYIAQDFLIDLAEKFPNVKYLSLTKFYIDEFTDIPEKLTSLTDLELISCVGQKMGLNLAAIPTLKNLNFLNSEYYAPILPLGAELSSESYDEEFIKNILPQEKTFLSVTYSDGSKYTGNFENGLRHGQGTFIDSSGSVIYEGAFDNGELHGKVKVNRKDGTSYEAFFVRNKFIGLAT